MKKLIPALCFALIASLVLVDVQDARRVDYDSGPIESLDEGLILVKGNRGVHVLEPLGVCFWCEEGMEVLITFLGFTRATLKPYSRSIRGRPIKVLVLEDGREQD